MKKLLCMFLVGILLLSIGSLTMVSAQPSQMAKESALLKILEKNLLRVGISTTAPPWGYLDDKYEHVGFDVDMARLMAEQLEVELELVETMPVNRVPYLVTNKVDVMISSFGNTLQRATSVAFSKPYAPYTQVVLGKKDDVDLKNWTDTSGRKVALVKGGTDDVIFSRIAPEGTEIVRYESGADTLLALLQGKVDAMTAGYTNAAFYVQEHPELEIKGDPFSRTFPCIGLPLGDQVWLNWVNLFIDQMLNQGKIQELFEKHFKVPWTEIWPSY